MDVCIYNVIIVQGTYFQFLNWLTGSLMCQLGTMIPLKVIEHPSWINSERLSLISVTQSLSFESTKVFLLFQAKLLEMNSSFFINGFQRDSW